MYGPGSGQYFRPAIKVSIIPNFWVFAATYKTDTQASSLVLMTPKKLVYPALFSQTTKAEREKGKQSLRWQVSVDEPCAIPRPPNKTRRKEFPLIEFKGKQDMIHDIRRTSSIAAQRIWNSGSTNHPGILKSSIPSQESN